MKKKLTILGCGSSVGSPWITNFKAKLKNDIKNLRTRCCAHISYGNLSILIDTSPDIKTQCLKNKIKSVDAIVYTHEHSDQAAGIFEMRPFYWKNKKKIPVYGSKRTINLLISKHTFCFKPRNGYQPIMKAIPVNKEFKIQKDKNILYMEPFKVIHGPIPATGYRFDNVAYISDCSKIPNSSIKSLYNLKYLIVDCLKFKKHVSHFNYDDALKLIDTVKPKKAILTNLHTDLDYRYLKRKLPSNIIPAFDGLNFNF